MKKNIWLDGMMGLVVGDALGVPVQFLSREEIKNRPKGPVTGMEAGGVYDMPEGTWSDDSSMALATLASIIEKKVVDPGDTMMRFVKWELKGEYTPFGEAFDQGNTCSKAIYKFIKFPDIKNCGVTGEFANGNGALMRILPACLYYYARSNESGEALAQVFGECRDNESEAQSDRQKKVRTSDDEAIEGIHVISGLTHNHIRSKMCCGMYYFMIKSILDGVKKEQKTTLEALLQEGIDNGLKYYGRDIRNLTEMARLGRLFRLAKFKDVPEEQIKTTGYVIDTIEAVVWCLITTKSYRECMLKAVNLGDDTDTVAAIAGGLAGLYYGYENIPKVWLAVIKRREWIEGMCEALVSHEDIDTMVVDIHSHMLPGIDDGSGNLDITKQMIKLAYSEGCRHLFLTPHAGYLEYGDAKVPEKMEAIREWIAAEKMNLKIYPGAEIYAAVRTEEEADTILKKVKTGLYPTLNGTKYVLIEFSLGSLEIDRVLPVVQGLIAAGYTPVIAHAERYGMCLDKLRYLKSLGCLLQMNICDLYYKYENDTNRMTHMLLQEKMFDFVGTDSHGIDRRPPKMKEYIDFLYRNYDEEYVDAILFENAVEMLGVE